MALRLQAKPSGQLFRPGYTLFGRRRGKKKKTVKKRLKKNPRVPNFQKKRTGEPISNRFRTDFEPISNRIFRLLDSPEPISNRFRTDFEPKLPKRQAGTDFEPISNRFRTEFEPNSNRINFELNSGRWPDFGSEVGSQKPHASVRCRERGERSRGEILAKVRTLVAPPGHIKDAPSLDRPKPGDEVIPVEVSERKEGGRAAGGHYSSVGAGLAPGKTPCRLNPLFYQLGVALGVVAQLAKPENEALTQCWVCIGYDRSMPPSSCFSVKGQSGGSVFFSGQICRPHRPRKSQA